MNSTNSKTEETNNTSGSLNRKTKAQLIDIILRKDDVERKLRNELNNMSKEYNQLSDLKDACSDMYHEEIDELTSINEELKQELDCIHNNYKRHNLCYTISILIDIVLIGIICFMF